MKRIIGLLCLILLCSSAHAEVPIVADLSQNLVKVSTGFSGAEVLLFGATDGSGEVALVVRGEPLNYVVRKKEKQGLIWVNGDPITFMRVPSFYHFAASSPLKEILDDYGMKSNQLGLDNLIIRSNDPQTDQLKAEEFQTALVQKGVKNGLFSANAGKVRMLENRLFSSRIKFPADAPIGSYRIETYLIKNNAIASSEISPLFLSKTGLGAEIWLLARNHALVYGFISVLLALLFGYAANVVFRKG